MKWAALLAQVEAALGAPPTADFPDFPVLAKVSGTGQDTDNKGISRISRISRTERETHDGGLQEEPQQPICARVGARAREVPAEKREIREIREMLAGSVGYISRSIFQKREIREIEREANALRAAPHPAIAADPCLQLAFDERAAFLEYECNLPRADAEAVALAEVLPAVQTGKVDPVGATCSRQRSR